MLYANTDDGSSALWVLDDNGVVVDNISYSIADRAQILAQINEHYGTSFTGWSDNEIALSYGNTLPNWDAYEKIEMPEQFLWKFKIPWSSNTAFGKVVNGILICYAKSLGTALVANDDGLITGTNVADENWLATFIKPKLDELGISYTGIDYDTSTYNIDDTVQNWNEYTLLE